jgi:ligand-binding sensor domain-containing protein
VDKNDSLRHINIAPEDLFLNTYNSRNLPEGYLIFENEDATEKYLMLFQNDTITEVLRCPELNEILDSKPFLDLSNKKFYIPSSDGLNIYDMTSRKTTKIKGVSIENFLIHRTLGLLAFDFDGIYRITDSTCEKLVTGSFGNSKNAVEMSDGSIIINDFKSAYRYQNGSIELITESNSGIADIICDMEDNIWIASFDGLFNFFRLDFKNYYLEKDAVKTVLEDKKGNIWIGTFFAKLLLKSGNFITNVKYPPSSSIFEYRTFLFGSAKIDDRLYFPRDNDVLIYHDGRFSWAKLPYQAEDYDGYSKVIPYKEENILILRGTDVYLCNRNGKILRSFTNDELLQQDFQDIATDSRGRWMVTGHLGVSIIDEDSIRLFKGENSVVSISLCVDEHDWIWSSSGNRLNLLRNDSLVTVHSFKNDCIQGIFTVNKDYLLITTLHGIYFLNVSEYDRSGQLQFIHYNHNNGFTGINPQMGAMFKDSKGTFWMPCNNGVITFNPEELIRKIPPPKLHILACNVSSDNIRWSSVDDSDRNFSHRNRNVRFSFIGINFSAVENVRYHYRLRGFQDDWSEPTKQREITFNNLPHGDYVFEIYADAGTDESRSEIQAFSFSIKPAFWQTWWFFMLSILSLMTISAFMALYFQRRKNIELLQRLSIEKQLNELRIKSIRLKAIPHFNANVLSAIEYYIINRSKEEANRLLGIYSNFTYQTLREVDKASRSLQEELDYVQLYLQLEKLRFADKFDFDINIDPSINKEIQLPNMVLHTYCENAIKHAFSSFKSGGTLKITAKQDNDTVKIAVEDNGIGRAAAQANTHIRSTKQGLDILNRQIEIYNRFNKQKIVQQVVDLFNDGISCGTRFVMEVPFGFVYQ